MCSSRKYWAEGRFDSVHAFVYVCRGVPGSILVKEFQGLSHSFT